MLNSNFQNPITRTYLMYLNDNRKYLNYKNKQYLKVTFAVDFATTTKKYFASVGASDQNRERAIIDISNIENKYSVPELGLTNEQHIKKLNNLINSLPITANVEHKWMDYIREIRNWDNLSANEPVIIPMDEIVNKKLAVCRHRALILAGVMGNLIKEGKLNNGSVRQYRDNVPAGAHTWVVYHDKVTQNVYLIDPMWGQFLNLNKAADLEKANQYYSVEIISRMLTRLNQLEPQQPANNNNNNNVNLENTAFNLLAQGQQIGFLKEIIKGGVKITPEMKSLFFSNDFKTQHPKTYATLKELFNNASLNRYMEYDSKSQQDLDDKLFSLINEGKQLGALCLLAKGARLNSRMVSLIESAQFQINNPKLVGSFTPFVLAYRNKLPQLRLHCDLMVPTLRLR